MNAGRGLRPALLVAALALAPGAAAGQEFAAPSAGPFLAGSPLESGLPSRQPGGQLGALQVRRPLGLTTRALIASGGWRFVRAALGLARTGDEALGWTTAAAAAGVVLEGAGIGVRCAARREDGAAGDSPLEAATPAGGAELGLGAWVGDDAWRAWISAPQLGQTGEAPPLARGLVTGADFADQGVFAGVAREAPRQGFAESAAWRGRVGLDLRALAVWAECRDHPWRGGVGTGGRVGWLRCSAQVDAHPVLEPTVRVLLSVAPPESR